MKERKGGKRIIIAVLVIIIICVVIGLFLYNNSKQKTINQNPNPASTSNPNQNSNSDLVAEKGEDTKPSKTSLDEACDLYFSCFKNCPKSLEGKVDIDCVDNCADVIEIETGNELGSEETSNYLNEENKQKFDCLITCAAYEGFEYDCVQICLD